MSEAKDILTRFKNQIRIIEDYGGAGIYFLIKNDEIVYIGKSTRIIARIESHKAEAIKDFDKACYFLCPQEEMDEIEQKLIYSFAPKYNKAYNYTFYICGPYLRSPSKSDLKFAELIAKKVQAGKFKKKSFDSIKEAEFIISQINEQIKEDCK